MYTKEELVKKADKNNYDSKIASSHITEWANSSASELYQVYDNYSSKKEDAMKFCKDFCKAVGGEDMRILSHNSNFFSIGFIVKISDGQYIFVYHTYANTRVCWM